MSSEPFLNVAVVLFVQNCGPKEQRKVKGARRCSLALYHRRN